jgi:protein TonB
VPAEAATAPADAAPRISPSWQQALESWIASHKVYPKEAQRRGEEGMVTLRFTVEPSGQVVDVAVVRGSGSARLDAAAEALLHGAALPPFDPSMRQAPITTTMRIHYALED